jgi:hypothetical protein
VARTAAAAPRAKAEKLPRSEAAGLRAAGRVGGEEALEERCGVSESLSVSGYA